jgi:hypothetical protein
MTSTAPSPTPFTAPRPKRMTFVAAAFSADLLALLPLLTFAGPSAFAVASTLTTEKSVSDSLMSGRNTAMPFAFASAMNFTTASVSSLSHVSSAAKNSTGK